MFIHNIDPVFLRIGFLEIRYYGIIFAFGFLLTYLFLKHLSKQRNLEFDLDNFLLYQFIGVLVGARFFEVFIYNFSLYSSDIFSWFAIWNGGLSFHGGLIGSIIATLIFCKKYKLDFYKIADITVIPVALALALGRIANFINSELYGRITSVPWAVKFQNAEGFRHPSQIYESMKNFFIFFILWFIKDKKLPNGFMFWSFIFLYSTLRFSIEFFREPTRHGLIYGLTFGQLLNIPLIIIGLYFLIKYRKVY